MEFQEDASLNIVKLYGSWVQNQKYSMLMEYVGGGTLEEFFRYAPPIDEEFFTFWERLSDVMKALARMHRHPDPDNKQEYLEG